MARVTDKGANGGKRKNRHGKDLPIGGPVRVSRLNTLPHIYAEKGRVYRECRQREGKYPDSLAGSRLVGMLNELSSQLLLQNEVSQLAQQVADLRELVMARESKEGKVYVPGAENRTESLAERIAQAPEPSAISHNSTHPDTDDA